MSSFTGFIGRQIVSGLIFLKRVPLHTEACVVVTVTASITHCTAATDAFPLLVW